MAIASAGQWRGIWGHALGMALIVAGLKLDADSRLAALLFAVPAQLEHGLARSSAIRQAGVAQLVDGISRLNRMRPITRALSRIRSTAAKRIRRR
jgi:GTP pyrophosphokinase